MACNHQTLFSIFDLVCFIQYLVFLKMNSIVFHVSLFPRFLSTCICHCHLVLYWLWYLSLIYSWTVVLTETLIDGEPILKLPAKTIQLSKIDFTPEERAFYLTLEEGSRQKFKVPSTLHHLSSVGYKLNCLSMMLFLFAIMVGLSLSNLRS